MEINPDTLEIEVVDIEPIEGGVQVFARAWSDGQQVGFGKDGTVDIERFRIFNPPILVPDENGDVYRYATQEELDNDEHGLVQPVMRYREDLEGALLVSLADIIGDIAKFDSSNIQQGKIGNTTSTFYSNSSAEDGQVGAGRSDWDTVHDAATGGSANATATQPRFQTGNNNVSTGWENQRLFFAFDTSALPDSDTIDSAVLSLRGTNKIDQGNGSAVLVSASPASPTTLSTADYDQCGAINNPTEMASRIDITSWSTTGFNAYALNANGLANISKTGISYFGLRSSADCDDDVSAIGLNQNQTVLMYSNEQSGNTDAPKLVVEHAAGGGTDYDLDADTQSYNLTGNDAQVTKLSLISPVTTSFALTAFDVGLSRTYVLQTETASFVLTPNEALPAYTRVLVADTAQYDLDTSEAQLLRSLAILAAPATYDLTPSNALLPRTFALLAGTATYTLATFDAIIARAYGLIAENGAYELEGFDVTFSVGLIPLTDPFCPQTSPFTKDDSPFTARDPIAVRPGKNC